MAEPEDIAAKVLQRYGDVADRVSFYAPYAADRDRWKNILAAFKQRVTADDTLMVVLIGHGTSVGTVAKFNLVGPDMDSSEWKVALQGIAGRVVFVNTTSSSGGFLPVVSGPGRAIVTGTRTGGERNETLFPQYFVEAFAASLSGVNLEDKYLSAMIGAAEMVMKGCTAAYDLAHEFPLPSVE